MELALVILIAIIIVSIKARNVGKHPPYKGKGSSYYERRMDKN